MGNPIQEACESICTNMIHGMVYGNNGNKQIDLNEEFKDGKHCPITIDMIINCPVIIDID